MKTTSSQSSCPNENELLQFVAGKLMDDQAEVDISNHLENCGACLSVLEKIGMQNDDLIFAVQKGNYAGSSLNDAYHRVYQKVVAIGDNRVPPKQNIPDLMLPKIQGYQVLKQIGRGGMGIVYEAEHETLKRRVALKLIPRSWANDKSAVERFYREARAAGRLHHTNIVPVFDIGSSDETHYYAMQLISGVSVSELIGELGRLHRNDCDKSQQGEYSTAVKKVDKTIRLAKTLLDESASMTATGNGIVRQADSSVLNLKNQSIETSKEHPLSYYQKIASMGQQVSEALAYAHEQGVIHRDIKPANLLLDDSGNTWVTDFGLAKTEDDGLTKTGNVVGTLRYIAPERFRGICDHRSDIYSLGISLYELLALQPVFEESDQVELMRKVQHEDPKRLSTIDSRIPIDLRTIVLRSIAKDPANRYQSASSLADDLGRFLDGRPVLARQIMPWERLLIWSRRNPLPAILTGLLLMVLIATAVGSTLAAFKFRDMANAQTKLANDANESAFRAERLLYYADMRSGEESTRSASGYAAARDKVAKWEQDQRGLRDWEWHWLKFATEREDFVIKGNSVSGIDISADGKWCAFSDGQVVKILNLETMKVTKTISGAKGIIKIVKLNSSATSVATTTREPGVVSVFDVKSGTLLHQSETFGDDAGMVTWSHDDEIMTFLAREHVDGGYTMGTWFIWETETWQERRTTIGRSPASNCLDFSPTGDRIAVGINGVTVYDFESMQKLFSFNPKGDLISMAWHPTDDIIAVGTNRAIAFWDVSTDKPKMQSEVLDGCFHRSVDWNHDGSLLAATTRTYAVNLFKPGFPNVVHQFRGAEETGQYLKWAPHEDKLFSTSSGGLRCWDLNDWLPTKSIPVTIWNRRKQKLNWNAENDLAVGQHNFSYLIRDRELGTLLPIQKIPQIEYGRLSLNPKNDWRAGCRDGVVHVWQQTKDGQKTNLLSANLAAEFNQPDQEFTFVDISWNPAVESELVISAGIHSLRGVWIWDVEKSEQPRRILPIEYGYDSLAWSPDGKWIATTKNNQLLIHDRQEIVSRIDGFNTGCKDICWSPDCSKIARAGNDGDVILVDSKSGEILKNLVGHTNQIWVVAWSPCGKRFASGGADHTVRVWDVESGETCMVFQAEFIVNGLSWSPDGSRLVATWQNKIKVWDARFPKH